MTNKLRKMIEEKDWYLGKLDDGWEISKYSPAGEDFFIVVDEATFRDDIKSAYENFDADDHAEMWINNRDFSGVPQSVRALIDDADAIKDMLKELYETVEAYYVKTETRTESTK